VTRRPGRRRARLNKSYGDKHVVQDLTIQVETGKITGFLGPNGSGKTTTCGCCAAC
jgi:ABC-type multidrug transport system ATPase subunit